MKKWIALLLCLLLPTAALAEIDLSQYSVTNATVEAVNDVEITAPCAGTLLPYDIKTGDEVHMGDVLFSMLTMDVYAAEDGQITAIFAQPGDDAASVMGHFGSLGAMDPAASQLMTCTISGAYNSDDTKVLHVGETLYFKSAKTSGDKGTGRVIAVDSTGYTVEILTGKFSVAESMSLYRDSSYASRDCVGKGVVVQRSSLTFSGAGLVTEVYVRPGDAVKAGDKILTLLPTAGERSVSPDITAASAGVIGAIAVAPGQQVWKGAMLCRMYLTDELEIVADVDEMDLNGLGIGSTVFITVDTAKNNVISGQITWISSLGVTRGNAAYYTIHVSLPKNNGFMLGQSASLYLPKN